MSAYTAMAAALTLGLCATAGIAETSAAMPERAHRWQYIPNPVEAPAGASNVLLVMTDDVGFGASSTFGGPIPTSAFDALARKGLRYNMFHTYAMCSPTRAALLTGRNPHAVGTGMVTETAVDLAGYTSVLPRSAATVARVLRDNGYDTAMIGKNHNTPIWETGPMGPFDRWPNGLGFDYFYGFNGGYNNEFAPRLIENRNAVDQDPGDPSYFLDRDLADHLIHWLRLQRTQRPERPFFVYWAPAAMHWPIQAPRDWIARFRGRFDMGWDRLREQTFQRQRAMGIIPSNAVLTPRPTELPAWDSLNGNEKQVYARMMEVAAAQLAFCDGQIGHVLEELRSSGQLDNTLVIYVQGDNGASQESLHGNMRPFGIDQRPEQQSMRAVAADIIGHLDSYGSARSMPNHNAAWAWAMNTPFRYAKQIGSHLGATRNGLVISWPARIPGNGLRRQFHTVADIAPTVYEATGVSPPYEVDGVAQQPLDGVSMVYSFGDAKAPSTHREQYFEMLGNRAFYQDGWMASTTPVRQPWEGIPQVAPEDYAWELYDLREDYSQARDVAAAHPRRLAELRSAFDEAARRFKVLPLTYRGFLASGATRQSTDRPNLLEGRKRFVYYPGPTRYPRRHAYPLMSPPWSISLRLDIVASTARGPILSVGDPANGVEFVMEDGCPAFYYNPAGRDAERVVVRAPKPLGPGTHNVELSLQRSPEAGEHAARWSLQINGRLVDATFIPVFQNIMGDLVVGRAPVGGSILQAAPGAKPEGFSFQAVTISPVGSD